MFQTAEMRAEKPEKSAFAVSCRGLWRRVFSLLAVVAISLNLLVPMTHSAMAAAGSDIEYVEICSKNGIERVAASELFGEEHQAIEGTAPCDACPDCPLCWFGANAALNIIPVIELAQKQLIKSGVSSRQDIGLSSPPFWGHPALRGPPETV